MPDSQGLLGLYHPVPCPHPTLGVSSYRGPRQNCWTCPSADFTASRTETGWPWDRGPQHGALDLRMWQGSKGKEVCGTSSSPCSKWI